MFLEIDKGAPIPALDACACCMASGATADLRRVRCNAYPPDDNTHAAVWIALPMCALCRQQRRRQMRIAGPVAAIAAIAAVALGVLGFFKSGLITAIVLAFVAFIGVILAATSILKLHRRMALRRGHTHHASNCIPLASGQEVTRPGGGSAAQVGVSTRFVVDFANDSFAKLLLSKSNARIRLPGSWSSVGILFDIDVLKRLEEGRADSNSSIKGAGAHYYGHQARLIFMKLFDPEAIGSAMLFHGDTAATLAGQANHWCIAVAVKEIAAIELISNAFMASEEEGLVVGPQRIIHHPRDVMWQNGIPSPFGPEPLSLWFATDDDGTIMLSDPPNKEDVALSAQFHRRVQIVRRD